MCAHFWNKILTLVFLFISRIKIQNTKYKINFLIIVILTNQFQFGFLLMSNFSSNVHIYRIVI